MQTSPIDQSSQPAGAPAHTPRPRRVPLSNLQIILIALIVVGGRLVIDFSQRIVEGQQKIAEQRDLEREIEVLLQEKQDLETAKARYSSRGYVEFWAHDEGKMVREGEVLVIPIYEGTAQSPDQPVPGSQAGAPIPAWRVWWSLFFDSPPPFAPTPRS